jgi:hypothetical protein
LVILGSRRPYAPLVGHDPSRTTLHVYSRVSKKKNRSFCLAALFLPYCVAPCVQLALPARCARPSPAAPLVTSAVACSRSLLAAPTRHSTALPTHACSPTPSTAEYRRLPFFQDLTVASLNSMWAPSSLLLARAAASGELHTLTRLHSLKHRGDVALKAHVVSVCFQVFQLFLQVYCKFFIQMLQSGSGYCICCNGCTRMLQASVPNVSFVFSRRMLQACLFGCCIYFTHMLQIFYLDVVYVYNSFQVFFMCLFL